MASNSALTAAVTSADGQGTPSAGDERSGPLPWGRALVFQALAQMVNRGSAILVVALLARRLTTDEVALVAALAVGLTWSETIAGGGLVDAVVYFPDDRGHRRAARRVAATLALALGGAFMLLGPFFASVLDQPEATWEFRSIGVSTAVLSLAALGDGRLRKRLEFGRRAVGECGRAACRIGLAVLLEAAGAGPWTFIAALLAGDVVFLLLVSALSIRPRPAAVATRTPTGLVFRYSIAVAGALIAARLVLDVDYVMIATRIDATALTSYVLAFRIVELTVLGVLATASAVAFPLYRQRAMRGHEALRATYLGVIRLQAVCCVAFGLVIILHSTTVVDVIYGERWSAAAPLLGWLAAYGIGRSLGAGAVDAYKAIGRPGYATGVAVARFLVLVPVLFVAAGASVVAVAMAQAMTAFVLSLGMQLIAVRLLGLSVSQVGLAMAPAVLAVALVVGVHLAGSVVLSLVGGPAALMLAADALTATAVLAHQVKREGRLLSYGTPTAELHS